MGLLPRLCDQGAQSGPGGDHLLGSDRLDAEVAGDGCEEVLDILPCDVWPGLGSVLVAGVGGADEDRVAAADREDRAPVGGVEDDDVSNRQALRGQDHVDALGEVEARRGLWILESVHAIHPGPRGIDDAAGADPHPPPGERALGLHSVGVAVLAANRIDRSVVQDRRTAGDGAAQIGEHQARVLGEVLPVDTGVGEARAIQDRLLGLEFAARPVAVQIRALHRAELLVGGDSRAHLHQSGPRAGRHHHPPGLGQVRREAVDLLALESGLAHQGDVAHGQVAEAPVDQLRGSARGSRREVLGLEQRYREPAQGGLPGDAGAGDASTDHRAVEALPLESIESRGAIR